MLGEWRKYSGMVIELGITISTQVTVDASEDGQGPPWFVWTPVEIRGTSKHSLEAP